ncbi:unnamed protein product, partial [Rotaria sordida]
KVNRVKSKRKTAKSIIIIIVLIFSLFDFVK